MGVPTLACQCPVCTSSDPHDRRLRPSVLLRWPDADSTDLASGAERIVVIDTGPDFREQALRARLTHVDAVLYTHGHADHILGMDDLRPLSFIAAKKGGPIPLYADREAAATLERTFAYTFSPQATYTNRARVQIVPLADGKFLARRVSSCCLTLSSAWAPIAWQNELTDQARFRQRAVRRNPARSKPFQPTIRNGTPKPSVMPSGR